MAAVQYFAYGSSMLTKTLRARCKSAARPRVAAVDGYRLAFSKKSQDGSGKATISAATGGRVFGVVFDLNEHEPQGLDQAEGAGKGYDRIDDFSVYTTNSQEPLRVVTYIADPAFTDPDLKPYNWYLNLIVAGAREHGIADSIHSDDRGDAVDCRSKG